MQSSINFQIPMCMHYYFEEKVRKSLKKLWKIQSKRKKLNGGIKKGSKINVRGNMIK